MFLFNNFYLKKSYNDDFTIIEMQQQTTRRPPFSRRDVIVVDVFVAVVKPKVTDRS